MRRSGNSCSPQPLTLRFTYRSHQWTTNSSLYYVSSFYVPYYQQQQTQDGPRIFFNNTQQITNADQGALFSWQALLTCYSFATNCVDGAENHLTSLTGGALAADVIWDAGGYQPSTPVLPVLQLQDGSYVGSVNSGAQNLMMAFDASGGVKWAMPGYSPQMAIADGGFVATSGGSYDPISGRFVSGKTTTFDASANATGQIASFPTYSWKGAYQLGSIDSLIPSFDLANIAPTFAAVPGGNLTGNGFSLRHHSFGLVFCNTGPGGDGQCPVINPNDSNPPSIIPMTFSYLPGTLISSDNYQGGCDFSVSSSCDGNTAHQDWVNAIKIQALNAYKEAFTNLPAIVSHQVATDMLYGGSNNPRFEHTVYIDGSWLDLGEGLTSRGDFSRVFYPKVIFNAEIALGPYGQARQFIPPLSDTSSTLKLVGAIGRGIGNAAAHETGHQIAFTVPLPGMECGPGSDPRFFKDCQDKVNSVYEAAAQDVWDFLPYIPPIAWEPMDQTVLQNYFKCTAAECK